MRGFFITFEGNDGSGKSSVIGAIKEELETTINVLYNENKLEFDEPIGDDNDVVIQKEKQGYCSIADTYTFTSNYASYW